MAQIIYILCILTSLACAWLLLGSYRRTRHRLLFWSGMCFVVITLNNVLLMVDRVIFPNSVDLLPYRLGSALLALLLLLYGLIYEKE
ncbi:DUF5985 family protein [Massilia soli]|uniref:DUF5985 family protein n=1 Tax=Massilia soli TaxID=2792854 RepID=A0ABS7SUT9_9BURK|nr:DUF5985 family protein [Massilia soli]MBZ2209691.1 DUF5985 family protein [Massilia soli]